MVQLALLVIALGLIWLVAALCTEGYAWWQYRRYPVEARAVVVDEMAASLDISRGTVEVQQADGGFQRIMETGDRNVGHQPFYHFLFEKNKYQYLLQWEAEGKVLRGYYRFLKKKGAWMIGNHVTLHCQPGKPWNYAVKDEQVWRVFLGKCLGAVTVLFVGIILFLVNVG